MTSWTPKVDGVDYPKAADINNLQTLKLDKDGTDPVKTNNFCSVYLGTDQLNLVDATPTLVSLDTEIAGGDPGAAFAVGTYLYTAPVAGRYLVTAAIRFWHIVADKDYGACIYVNGANAFTNFAHSSSAAGLDQLSVPIVAILNLTAGQTVGLWAYVNAGVGTVDVYSGATRTFMQIHFLSAATA
jgi:hypothetical protein